MFKFYYNNITGMASRWAAVAALMFGMMMAGMGVLIAAFPKVFAYMAAAGFFAISLACALFAIRMLFAGRRARKEARSNMDIIDVNPM